MRFLTDLKVDTALRRRGGDGIPMTQRGAGQCSGFEVVPEGPTNENKMRSQMGGPKSHKKDMRPFLRVPTALLNCPKYRALSSIAVKLLFDIAGQYNGKNNGDLCAAWKVMRPKGWNSEATLNKAKKELVAAGFIAVTRIGRLPNKCTLYGITWQALNPNAKLDYGPGGFPYGEWEKLPSPNVTKNAHANTETVVEQPRIATETIVEDLV